MKSNPNAVWVSIPEAARRGPLKECTLRRMRDNGTLPCLMIGRKALVNYPKLIELLSRCNGSDITSDAIG